MKTDADNLEKIIPLLTGNLSPENIKNLLSEEEQKIVNLIDGVASVIEISEYADQDPARLLTRLHLLTARGVILLQEKSDEADTLYEQPSIASLDAIQTQEEFSSLASQEALHAFPESSSDRFFSTTHDEKHEFELPDELRGTDTQESSSSLEPLAFWDWDGKKENQDGHHFKTRPIESYNDRSPILHSEGYRDRLTTTGDLPIIQGSFLPPEYNYDEIEASILIEDRSGSRESLQSSNADDISKTPSTKKPKAAG